MTQDFRELFRVRCDFVSYLDALFVLIVLIAIDYVTSVEVVSVVVRDVSIERVTGSKRSFVHSNGHHAKADDWIESLRRC